MVLVGLYFLCDYYKLPHRLTAGILLFVFMSGVTIIGYKKFRTPQKVGFIGLVVASGLLSGLFAYDHFIKNIRITVFHIFAVLLPPIVIGNYLLKREKEKTYRDRDAHR